MAQQYSNIQMATPMVTAQPQDLNLKYGKSKPGLLKILSVVLGFIAVYLSAYAYDNAIYAKPKYGTICTVVEGHFFSDCDTGYFPTDDLCEFWNKFNKKKAEFAQSGLERQILLEQIQTCPSRWLVVPQIYVIGIIWGFTLIILIVMMISERKVQTFQKLDLPGHIVAALLVIVSGLCFIGYFVTVMVGDKCKRRVSKNSGGRPRTLNVTAERRQYENGNPQQPPQNDGCDEAASFKHIHILFAGIFAIFTGIVYILIGVNSKGMGQKMMGQQQQQQQYFSASQQVIQMQATQSQQANPFQYGYAQPAQPAQPGYQYSPQEPPPINQTE